MRTPNILISTNVNDFHAAAVHCALKHVGANPILWFNSDHPTHAASSWAIGHNALSVRDHARKDRVEIDLGEIDSFWHRRPARPTIKKGLLNPADEQSAFECTREFLRGIHRYLDSHAFAVNNTVAAEACENKMTQLAAAVDVGFQVPDTLISNDARAIKDFIARRKTGETVFKPLQPTVWRNADVSAVSYTTAVTLGDLPNDTVLEMAPGILQERIDKLFELRVTCFGNEVMAVRLMSQEHADALYDFRSVDPYKLRTEEFKLPTSVEERCRRLMRHPLDCALALWI